MSTSVAAVKGLMKTLGVKFEELLSAEEALTMIQNYVKNKKVKLTDLYSPQELKKFVETQNREDKDLVNKICTLENIKNAISSQNIALKDLFPTEAKKLEIMQSAIESLCQTFDKAVKTETSPQEEITAKQEKETPAPQEISAAKDELELIDDPSGYTYAKQAGKVIGIVIEGKNQRFIVMHNYAPDNLSKQDARALAAKRPQVNGHSWRLMTNADCKALCSEPYAKDGNRGGKGYWPIKNLMEKLGGSFEQAEHLTEESNSTLHKVKFVVDL